MIASLRLLAFGLIVFAPLTASATSAPGQSDLDRLSDSSVGTSTILGEAPAAGSTENVMPPDPPPSTTPVPVDGGLSLLALAGAGYAAKRLRARRRA